MDGIVDSEKKQKAIQDKISGASKDDKKVDPLTSQSNVGRWKDDKETEKAEEKLYREIKDIAKKAVDDAEKCLKDAAEMKKTVEATDDFASLEETLAEFDKQSNHTKVDSEMVKKQWE